MRIRHILYFFTVIGLLTSCGGNRQRFVIIGNITGIPDENIVLEQLTANDVITIIDSVHPNKEGHFEFCQMAAEPGLFRLHFRSSKFILLSLDKENIKIIADWKNIEKYNITGSPASENLRVLIANYRDQMKDFHTMNIVMDTLKAKGNDSMLEVARKDIAEMNQKFTRYIEIYADTTPYLPNAVFAARMLNPAAEITYLDQFTQSLAHRFPGTKMAKDFAEYYLKVSGNPIKQNAKKANLAIGDNAPEINLFNIDHIQVSLASMRGKYVLIDFWASFCQPCRAENPNIVAIYKKYRNKNFEIYGISLDNNREAWEKAVKADGITWSQVSDLKRWESPVARQYGVEAIPANFLIDTSGKIIARDLRGETLGEKLESLLK